MATNDDSADIEIENDSEDWTPRRGLSRGLVITILVACVIAAIQGVVTYYIPRLVLHGLLNGFGAFMIAWILFATMHRASGQVGGIITWLVVILACLVISSKHIVLAQHGVFSLHHGQVTGWQWLHPLTICVCNIPAWIGVVAATWMCREGDSILSTVLDLLNRNPYWR